MLAYRHMEGRRFALVALCLAPALAHADARLGEPRVVARGDLRAPRFSPDGASLLVTGPGFAGLALVPAAGGAPRDISSDEGAGWDARFLADGRVAFTARRAGARRPLVRELDGTVRGYRPTAELAFARDDRVWVTTPTGALRSVGTGDRFFSPVVSPDGARIAFLGLATGVWVYERATARLVHLGPGTAPAWSPEGRRLIFERTEDDGHAITASELFLWDAAGGGARVTRLTATDRRIERRPSFSPDGRMIAFDDDAGAIWVAPLEAP